MIRSIGMVFSNGAMVSVSDKSDSVGLNERYQQINEIAHFRGKWMKVQWFQVRSKTDLV